MTGADLPARVPEGQVLIYQDGALNLQVRLDGRTVWLTQSAMAELYQTTPQNITIHVARIYADGELDQAATCKEYLQVRREGDRDVRRALKHYRLDMILAVGYRVRSPRGTQFRQWATASGPRAACRSAERSSASTCTSSERPSRSSSREV